MGKSVGIRKEREEGNYFLKLQIFTSFLKNICFSELLNGVHLSSIANQKDREKAFFSKKEKKTNLSSPFQRKLSVTTSYSL